MHKIIHIDMDAFYASVEQRDNPKLKGKPIIVGGRPERRGVVSTASYEARKFGIKSAMPTKTALSLYPDLIVIDCNFAKYEQVSNQLIEIYKNYTDLIEPLSLDECFLDVTNNKTSIKTATEIGKIIKNRIKKELNLTASVGVAPNKLLAKIASDINKPDGIFIIKPHEIDNFITNLDVYKIWGVGKVTYENMKKLNIKTCGDLQKFTMLELLDKFGSFGEALYYFARGIDDRTVESVRIRKSIGTEETFPTDTDDMEFLKNILLKQINFIAGELKQNDIRIKTVTLKIKFSDFIQITRSSTFNYYTSNEKEIANKIIMLFNNNYKGEIKKIRLIGVSVSNFENQCNKQLEFDL